MAYLCRTEMKQKKIKTLSKAKKGGSPMKPKLVFYKLTIEHDEEGEVCGYKYLEENYPCENKAEGFDDCLSDLTSCLQKIEVGEEELHKFIVSKIGGVLPVKREWMLKKLAEDILAHLATKGKEKSNGQT